MLRKCHVTNSIRNIAYGHTQTKIWSLVDFFLFFLHLVNEKWNDSIFIRPNLWLMSKTKVRMEYNDQWNQYYENFFRSSPCVDGVSKLCQRISFRLKHHCSFSYWFRIIWFIEIREILTHCLKWAKIRKFKEEHMHKIK